MHNVMEEAHAQSWEVMGINQFRKAMKRSNSDLDEVQVLWLIHRSQQFEITSTGSNDEAEGLLRERDFHGRSGASSLQRKLGWAAREDSTRASWEGG